MESSELAAKITTIKSKINVERNIMSGAQALSRASPPGPVRDRAEGQIREAKRMIDYLMSTLQDLELQIKNATALPPLPSTEGQASPASARSALVQSTSATSVVSLRPVSPVNELQTVLRPSNKTQYSKLDLIKITTPYTAQRINFMLHQLEYKMTIETQLKKGSEAMSRALAQGNGDRKAKASAEATVIEADRKMLLIQRALKRYKNLEIFPDEDQEERDTEERQKANIRKALSGTLYMTIHGARDLDHISSGGKFASAETIVVLKSEGQPLAQTKSVKSDTWRETFSVPIENVNEIEINVYDKKSGGSSLENANLIGIQWIRLDDLVEALRKKRVQEETAASWSAAQADSGKGTTTNLPRQASVRQQQVSQQAHAMATSTNPSHGIEAWFNIEPVGNLCLSLQFVKSNAKKRAPMAEAGLLKRQVAITNGKDNVIEQNGHRFVPKQFVSIVLCALCGEFLRVGAGVVCEECNFTCHKECHSKVITQCVASSSKDRDEDKINHRIPHSWGPVTSIAANWCCHCGHMLPLRSKTAKKCSECSLACHTDCTPLVPDFCGMPMLKANELLAVIKSIQASKQSKLEASQSQTPVVPIPRPAKSLEPQLGQAYDVTHTPPIQVEELRNDTQQLRLSDKPHTQPGPPAWTDPRPAPPAPQQYPPQQPVSYPGGSAPAQQAPQPFTQPRLPGSPNYNPAQQQLQQQYQAQQANRQTSPQTNQPGARFVSQPNSPPQYQTPRQPGQSPQQQWTTPAAALSYDNPARSPPQQVVSQQYIQNRPLQQAPVVGVFISPPQAAPSRGYPVAPVDPRQAAYQAQIQSAARPGVPQQYQQPVQPMGYATTGNYQAKPQPQHQGKPEGMVVQPLGAIVGAPGNQRKIGLECFNFLAVLGKGNFGKVMLAEEKSTSTLYAIKVLKKAAILEDDSIDGMFLEKRAFLSAAKHRHPFLLELHSSFQTSTRVYFVMAFAGGGDLMLHVQRAQFSPKRTKFYAAEILLGLEYFHAQGIIYRDLKLENIMLGMDGHIKIADYGLCKEGMWPGVKTNTMCGTPEFMAPEIVAGEPYGKEVDWWAFAVLIYEMLLSSPPFRGEDEEEIYEAILGDTIMYPPQMPAHSVDLLDRLLVRNPLKRLGAGPNDAADIKRHPYFGDINWVDLYNKRITPPYIPSNTGNPLDMFDKEFTAEAPNLTPVTQKLTQKEQEMFRNFSYTADWAGVRA